MANEVKIFVNVIDKASATLDKIQAELAQTGKSGAAGFMGMSKAALGAVGGVTALSGAVVAAANFVQGAVNDWADYNEQIRKMSIATSAAPEDLSRMMQAADDLGVSMDSLQTAFNLVAKNGIQPTIENIAELSDKLLAIEDPTKRAEEAARLFGRQWAEIAPFVLAGGDAIREGTAAIDDSLVATQESIDQSRKYKESIDLLADSFTGLKNVVAEAVMPVMTEAMNSFSENVRANLELVAAQKLVERGVAATIDTESRRLPVLSETYDWLKQNTDWQNMKTAAEQEGMAILERLILGEISFAEAQEWANQKLREARDAFIRTEEVAGAYSDQIYKTVPANEESGKSASDMARSYQDAAEQINAAGLAAADFGENFKFPDITEKMGNWVDSMQWEAAGGSAIETFYEGMKGKIAGLGKAEQDAAMKSISALELTAKIKVGEIDSKEAISQFNQAFGAGGEAMISAALELNPDNVTDIQSQMNELTGNPELFPILNKESLDEAMATVENEKPEVKLMMSMDEGSLREALGKIPSSKTITLHVVTSGGGGGDIGKLENTYHTDLNGNGIIGKAAGGPVYVGNAYLVGERGPELFLPGASGSIVPNNGIGGGNTYITIYQQPGQSAMALAEIIAYQASRQSTASAAGIKYAGR